jgi:hypothetical protein
MLSRREAAYSCESDDIGKESRGQEPKAAPYSPQYPPAQHKGNQQVGKDRTEEFHGDTLRQEPEDSSCRFKEFAGRPAGMGARSFKLDGRLKQVPGAALGVLE